MMKHGMVAKAALGAVLRGILICGLAGSLVPVAGCGAVQLPGLSGAGTDDGDEPAGEGAGEPAHAQGRPASTAGHAGDRGVAPAAPTDTQVAEMGLRLATGTLHRVDTSGAEPTLEPGASSEQLEQVRSRTEDMIRRWFTEVNGYDEAEDPLGSPLRFEICLIHQTRLAGKSEEEARPYCGTNSAHTDSELRHIASNLAVRMFYFDRWVEHVSADVATRARRAFAASLGWKVVWDEDGTFGLQPVDPSTWPPRVLRVAQRYAEGDEELMAKLARAMETTPTHHCVWFPGVLVRDPHAGSFGPPRYDAELTPRVDIAGIGGQVECGEVPRRGDASMLRVVRTHHAAPDTVLAVTPIDGQAWITNRNRLGHVTSQTRIVKVFRRVER